MSDQIMKVIRLHGPGDLRMHEEPRPLAGPGEALLRVTAVGICGSDLHWFGEGGIGPARLSKPLILGHEFAGVVEEGPQRGQRVAVDPSISCGQCEFCREGNPNFCSTLYFAGSGADDGALRQYLPWPQRCLFPLPDSLTDEDGAMLEPLGIAIHAVDLAHLRSGITVGIFGCGPIGLLALQLAGAAGATAVIATDKLPHRLDAARALGATMTIQAAEGEECAAVWAATANRGLDVAFEAAGDNEAVEAAIECARPGARVVLIGIPDDDRTSFCASTARRKGLTIKLARRMKHVYPRALSLVESGRVNVRSLVTHRFSMAQIDQAFALAQKREGLKIIIKP